KTVPFKALLEHVAAGGTDPEILSSLASRLARLDQRCGPDERKQIVTASGGVSLAAITQGLVGALDADRQQEAARARFNVPEGEGPTEAQVAETRQVILTEAARPLTTNPDLRRLLRD